MNFRIVDLGCDEESYFPGHGVAFTKYTDTFVGQGDTAKDALEDCFEAIYQSDLDESDALVKQLEASDEYKALIADTETVLDRVGCSCGCDPDLACAVCAGTYHRYIAIDVKKEGV